MRFLPTRLGVLAAGTLTAVAATLVPTAHPAAHGAAIKSAPSQAAPAHRPRTQKAPRQHAQERARQRTHERTHERVQQHAQHHAQQRPRERAREGAREGARERTREAAAGAVVGGWGPGSVRARAAYLADDRTGRRLWSRDADRRRPIGSITKVMTALIVIRSGHLGRKIRINRRHVAYAAARSGSTARLRPGDRITARELLYALMLPSGCDAAVALADSYGPGRRAFVGKMNRLAARIGMRRTRYANVDGTSWPSPTAGRSTASDQVLLGRFAMRDPTFRALTGSRRHVLPAARGHRRYVWRTTNLLLGGYPGLIGIKTGFTRAAGQCFLFAARRHGRTLVGVVLHSSRGNPDSRFYDAVRVLDWGFRV